MASGGIDERALEVHRSAIVYDAVCPLAQKEATLDDLIEGGVTVVAPTIGGPRGLEDAMGSIGIWYERLRRRSEELLPVTRAEDMQRAKAEGRAGHHLSPPGHGADRQGPGSGGGLLSPRRSHYAADL